MDRVEQVLALLDRRHSTDGSDNAILAFLSAGDGSEAHLGGGEGLGVAPQTACTGWKSVNTAVIRKTNKNCSVRVVPDDFSPPNIKLVPFQRSYTYTVVCLNHSLPMFHLSLH
jgi:hypothetical protein